MHNVLEPSVLILECQARASIAIIRSFLDRNIKVTASADHRYCAGFFVHGLKNKALYPSLESHPAKFIEWLIDYLAKNPTEILFPLGDAGVSLIAKYQEEIRKHTKLVMPDYSCFMILHDKILANKAAEHIGIPIPRCWYPDENGLDSVIKSVVYPALLKPAIGVGARGIIHVSGPSDLNKKWNKAIKNKTRYFIQEYIPLSGRQYVVDSLIDPKYRTIAVLCSEKIRFYPITGGASTLNKTVDRKDICDYAIKLMNSIGYYGIGNSDFIEDPRDGIVKFLEINPRFGEMHAICNIAGIDMAHLLYRLAKGEKLEPVPEYHKGRFLRFGPTDFMWFVRSPDRFRANPGFWASFSKYVNGTLINGKDFGPFLGYVLENAWLLTDLEKLSHRFIR